MLYPRYRFVLANVDGLCNDSGPMNKEEENGIIRLER